MSSRLRSLDSKISFFAFADIITAVSGVLIFVALLLATDLGQPTDSRSQAANSEIEQRLQEALAQQVEADAQNLRLQELLATADTAPDLEKLQTDITRLRSQLSEEQKKQAALADQMVDSQVTSATRDKTLGLTDLKATVQRVVQEAESIARQDAKARSEMAGLEQRVAGIQSKLLKLGEREGKLWLIPDKNGTTKEPILATVSTSGVKLEQFDHPERARVIVKTNASAEFDSFLGGIKPLDQYVVFLVRPSGIELFERLVKLARDKGFDVGFDALEEDKEIYFSTPPIIDETTPVGARTASQNGVTGGYSNPNGDVVGADERNGSKSASSNSGQRGNAASNGRHDGNGNADSPSQKGSSGAQTGSGGRDGTNPQNGSVETARKDNGRKSSGGQQGGGSGVGEDNGKGNGSSSTTAASSNGNGHGPGDSASVQAEPQKNSPTPTSKSSPPPPQNAKGWWQRFLEWVGHK